MSAQQQRALVALVKFVKNFFFSVEFGADRSGDCFLLGWEFSADRSGECFTGGGVCAEFE